MKKIRIFANQSAVFCLFFLSINSFAQTLEQTERSMIQIATQLVANKPRLSSANTDFDTSKLQIVTAVPIDRLESLDQLGLLNILQTIDSGGTTSGTIDRLEGERRLIGHQDLGWQPTEVHPKSTYVAVGGIENQTFYSAYGDLLLVYRKSVWPRTTFTLRDSLEIMRDRKNIDEDRMFSLTHETSMLRGSSDAQNSSGLSHLRGLEGQVWGPINLYDIETVYVLREDYRKNKELLSRLHRKYGFAVKVYSNGSSIENPRVVLRGLGQVRRRAIRPSVTWLKSRLEKMFSFFAVLNDTLVVDALARVNSEFAQDALQKLMANARKPSPFRKNLSEATLWKNIHLWDYMVLSRALDRNQAIERLQNSLNSCKMLLAL